AMLVNPLGPDAIPEIRDVQAAARANGLQLQLISESTRQERTIGFESLANHNVQALLVGSDPFFMVRRDELVGLVRQSGLPAVYPFRELAAGGGLMRYGAH